VDSLKVLANRMALIANEEFHPSTTDEKFFRTSHLEATKIMVLMSF